jgi:DNA primase
MREKLNILKEVFGSYYKSRDEYLFACPYCKHHKRKLSINLALGVYKCWVCDSKGKSLHRLVNRFAPTHLTQKWYQLNNQVDMSEVQDIFEVASVPQEKQRLSLPSEFIFLGGANLPFEAQKPLRYLLAREITLQDIRFYKLGFCHEGEYRNRIIIPSFDDEGYCNYFVGRAYNKDRLKYKNPQASRNIVFNELLIDWRKAVTLVEGPFDALKARNSICVLGSTLGIKSRLFSKLVEKQPRVYIGFDNDALKKSLRVIKNMLEYGLEVYKMDTSEIEDLGSLSKSAVEGLKDNAVAMNFENFIFSSCR